MRDHTDTIATDPFAMRTIIRRRHDRAVDVASVTLTAEDLRGMTDAQIREALGLLPGSIKDTDHMSTVNTLDDAAGAV